MRERQEDEVRVSEDRRVGVGEDQVGDRPQVGVGLAHSLAGVRVRRDGNDLEVRVSGDQSQQFAAGVAAGARDRDPCSHVHDYAS